MNMGSLQTWKIRRARHKTKEPKLAGARRGQFKRGVFDTVEGSFAFTGLNSDPDYFWSRFE
jgi:hypothetical protein